MQYSRSRFPRFLSFPEIGLKRYTIAGYAPSQLDTVVQRISGTYEHVVVLFHL